MRQNRSASMEKFRQFRAKVSEWIEGIFASRKKTFGMLAIFTFTLLFLIQITIILFSNGFYNGGSDDVCQYYTIVNDFFNDIKTGDLSVFNLNNYFGASFFSDVYYVPLDVFTLIGFLFSYLMPFAVAYSSAELVKLFAGVMILAYYFYLKGMKNKTIFWMSLIYIVSGGMACFTAFPSFYSLVFYLPMSLVVIHWFHTGKSWVVPAFVFALVLYNFYSAFMVLAFMSILFVIESLKKTPFRIGKFFLDGMGFLGLILLGVAVSGIYLFPTVQFILEETYRGTGNFDGWFVHIGSWTLELFQPEIYIRMLAKTFTEQRASGFVGFLDQYMYEHVSLYITVIGLAFMSYVFFMRDKISWIYKGVLLLIPVMMFFPFFSYVFSGTEYLVDLPYTRWIDMLPLLEIVILAHVYDTHGWNGMKMKWLTIPVVFMLGVIGYLISYYIPRLEEMHAEILAGSGVRGYEALVADAVFLGIAAFYLILVLVFGWIKRMKWIKWVFLVEFIVGLGYIYFVSYALVNRITFFDDMESINVFLNDNIEQDEFYRVYVDVDRFNVQTENFNRMTTFWTNTKKIFHSWTDSETDAISAILFDETEHQEKDAMMVYNLYLEHVLGYKYLLLNADYSYNLPEEYFSLVATEGIYQLYEITDYEPFQVYETYTTYSLFDGGIDSNTEEYRGMMKLLTTILLEEAPGEETIQAYLQVNNALGNALDVSDTIKMSKTIAQTPTEVQMEDPNTGVVKWYYAYDAAEMEIGYVSGDVRFKFTFDGDVDYTGKSMFYVTSAGETKTPDPNDEKAFYRTTAKNNATGVITASTTYVKCGQFFNEPEMFYFEKTDDFVPDDLTIYYRLERAIGGVSYLVLDLPNTMPESGMIFMTFSVALEKVFVEDDLGNETHFIGNICYFSTKPGRVFIYKTGTMYAGDPFSYTATICGDDMSLYAENANSDLASNEAMTVEDGRITLSYTRTSESEYDQIVMVPVTYSEEWIITSEVPYQTVSVTGGFLGIVIPKGTTEVAITLKFVPKGLETGALITLGSGAVYAGIYLLLHFIKKKKKANQPILIPDEPIVIPNEPILTEPEATDHEETDSHSPVL